MAQGQPSASERQEFVCNVSVSLPLVRQFCFALCILSGDPPVGIHMQTMTNPIPRCSLYWSYSLSSAHCCTCSLQESVFTKTKLLNYGHSKRQTVGFQNRFSQRIGSFRPTNLMQKKKNYMLTLLLFGHNCFYQFFFAVHLSFGSNVVRQTRVLERASEEKHIDINLCLGHCQSVM